jgi:hypothetical protein
MIQDEMLSRLHDQNSETDDDAAEHERPSGSLVRGLMFYGLMILLGVGSAFAWHNSWVQSTISTGARAALGWRPLQTKLTGIVSSPAKPQLTMADLAQKIESLTREVGALKQQINQLNAAQAQSEKSATEQQLKLSALQQLLQNDERIRSANPKPSVLNTAADPK